MLSSIAGLTIDQALAAFLAPFWPHDVAIVDQFRQVSAGVADCRCLGSMGPKWGQTFRTGALRGPIRPIRTALASKSGNPLCRQPSHTGTVAGSTPAGTTVRPEFRGPIGPGNSAPDSSHPANIRPISGQTVRRSAGWYARSLRLPKVPTSATSPDETRLIPPGLTHADIGI